MIDPVTRFDMLTAGIGARIKAAVKWIYEWVTVITATLMGFLSYGVDAFNTIVGTTDIVPILPPESALKIVTGVAIVKGLVAYRNSRKTA